MKRNASLIDLLALPQVKTPQWSCAGCCIYFKPQKVDSALNDNYSSICGSMFHGQGRGVTQGVEQSMR